MKKMLFIYMVGSIFITSVATAQVVSTNIVGYTTIEGEAAGKMLLTSPFVSVQSTEQTFSLSQLTGNLRNFDTIELINSGGVVSFKAYYWVSDDEWYDWYTDDPVETNLLAGVAFLLETASKFDGFFAGQVEEEDISVPLNSGKTLVGNGSAVPLELSKFIFSGLANFNTVEFINASGVVVSKAYYWVSDNEWYDWDTDDPAGDWELFPGEGMLVECGGGFVIIPSALN